MILEHPQQAGSTCRGRRSRRWDRSRGGPSLSVFSACHCHGPRGTGTVKNFGSSGEMLRLYNRLKIYAAMLLFAASVLVVGVNFGSSNKIELTQRVEAETNSKSTAVQAIYTRRWEIRPQFHEKDSKILSAMKQSESHRNSLDVAGAHSLKFRFKSRSALKARNHELFAWDAALQHQILALCVSSAIADRSSNGSKSVNEIKHACLQQISRSVERDIMKSTKARLA